jgi:hypothetical protein
MRTWTVFLLLFSGMALGQQSEPSPTPEATADVATTATTHPVERVVVPTYADRYCAGFVSKQPLPDNTFVAGGLHSPHATKFVNGEVIYLMNSNFKEGDKLTLLRELRDPNRFEGFDGQNALLAATGQPYAELGHAKIVDTRHKMAIAQIDFSCEPVVPGDLVVPYVERDKLSFSSPVRFDRFAPSKRAGRIVLAKEFDNIMGMGAKVYLTIGSDQGLRVGDYLRISRPYSTDLHNPVDSISFKATTAEDTLLHPPSTDTGSKFGMGRGKGPVIKVQDMPSRALGELIVLSTTRSSATGMITFALEDVHVGDDVERETAEPTTADGSTSK